jgi:hypothetical protein
MASFIKRNGSWTARVRKTGYPETTHTFASKASALQWSQRVESDPEKFLTEQVSADHQLVTLGDLFRKYGEEVTPVRRQGFWNGRLLDSAESLAHLLFNIRRLDWRIANVVD